MFRQGISVALGVSIFYSMCASTSFASEKALQEARFTEKVRSRILSLGSGKEAIVQVKLRDKINVCGYISVAGPDSFTVTDPQTGTSTQVAYPKVKSVKGHNLSKSTKISIGVLIAVGVLVMLLIAAHVDDS